MPFAFARPAILRMRDRDQIADDEYRACAKTPQSPGVARILQPHMAGVEQIIARHIKAQPAPPERLDDHAQCQPGHRGLAIHRRKHRRRILRRQHRIERPQAQHRPRRVGTGGRIVADVFQAHAVNTGGQLSLEAPVNQARNVDQDFGHRGERLGRQAFWGKPDKFWR